MAVKNIFQSKSPTDGTVFLPVTVRPRGQSITFGAREILSLGDAALEMEIVNEWLGPQGEAIFELVEDATHTNKVGERQRYRFVSALNGTKPRFTADNPLPIERQKVVWTFAHGDPHLFTEGEHAFFTRRALVYGCRFLPAAKPMPLAALQERVVMVDGKPLEQLSGLARWNHLKKVAVEMDPIIGARACSKDEVLARMWLADPARAVELWDKFQYEYDLDAVKRNASAIAQAEATLAPKLPLAELPPE